MAQIDRAAAAHDLRRHSTAALLNLRKGTPGLDPWIQGAGRRKVAWGVLSTGAVPKGRYLQSGGYGSKRKPRYLRVQTEAKLSTTYVIRWRLGPRVAAIDPGHMTDDETQLAKKQKGGKYPKGVSETGRKNNIKFQARVGYKPNPDGKTVQRSAGTFETPEEAALQVAAYEAKLAAGIDPWNGQQVRSQHGRGQVRSLSPFVQRS